MVNIPAPWSIWVCADVWNYKKPEWGTSDVRDRGNEQSGFQGWGNPLRTERCRVEASLGTSFRLFKGGYELDPPSAHEK